MLVLDLENPLVFAAPVNLDTNRETSATQFLAKRRHYQLKFFAHNFPAFSP